MEKYQNLIDLAGTLGVDAIALVPGANFTRTFGAAFHTSERPLVVFIAPDGRMAAIVPELELTSFASIEFDGKIYSWRDQTGYDGAFAELANDFPMRRLAVEGQVMRVFVSSASTRAYKDLMIIDAESEISGLRIFKTDDEIAAMRRAIEISERALFATIADVEIGMTERTVHNMLVGQLFPNGAQALSFEPIIAGAANSAKPHAHAGEYKLLAGDALLIDFGVYYDGMASDITRTFFVGHADDHARAVYDTVLRANQAAFDATRAGVTAHAVDDAATRVLEASPFAEHILTKTGHGLGREVHEAPYIMRGNDHILEMGTVFTNEPGLYLDGQFGVRIEDDVLVTNDGAQNLTQFPKKLMVI